ncbi:hypothetical protein [Acidisoma sp. 7E03]
MPRNVLPFLLLCTTGLLAACSDTHVTTYRSDHKAFLKELIHCENNYAAEHNTPACRAAFKVNSELFPE